MSEEFRFKVLVLGDSDDKSRVIHEPVHGKFQKQFLRTSGIEPSSKYEIIDGNKVVYNIWDISAHGRFKKMHDIIFKNAHAAIVFFDLTDRSTFESIDKWIHLSREVNPGILLVIIGMNRDLVNSIQVSQEESQTKARDYMALEYIEIAQVPRDRMNGVFHIIGKELLRKR